MKRRIFSVLIALALCLSLLPAPALALDPEEPGGAAPAAGDPAPQAEESWPCGDNVTATLVDGTLTISGTGAMTDYTFSSDRPWHSKTGFILRAVIEEGVTSIGSDAFYYCQKLTSVEIPESVTSIGKGAFSQCKVLSGIQLPSGLTSIGASAFSYCRALTSIEIPSGVKTIGDTAFSSTGLTEVTIPDGVESIGTYAFSACNSLTKVNIPASVEKINKDAFASSPNAKIYYEGTLDEWNAITNGKSGATDDQLVINPHEVTIESNGGEKAEGAGTYSEGAAVTVSAGTKYGYAFNGWTATGVTLAGDQLANPNLTFTMPANDVTLTATWTEALAMVDDVGYATVQAAFDAIGSGSGRVYLLKDVTVDQPIKMSGGAVTLAGEGNTLTGTGLGTGRNTLEVIGGTLTLENVTVKNTYEGLELAPGIRVGGTAISISSGASLTVCNGATVTATGPSGIAISSAGTLVVNGGTVSATGDDSWGIRCSGGSAQIKGGTISGVRGLGLNTSSSFTVKNVSLSGGTFIGTTKSAIVIPNGSTLGDLLDSDKTLIDQDAQKAVDPKAEEIGPGIFTVGCGAHASVQNVASSGPDANGVVTVTATCTKCGEKVTLGTLTMVNNNQTITFGQAAQPFAVQVSPGLTGVSYSWNNGASTNDTQYQPTFSASGELKYPCAVTFSVPGGSSATVNLEFTLTVNQLDITNAALTVELPADKSFSVPYNGQEQAPDVSKVLIGGKEFKDTLFDITLVDASDNAAEKQKNAGTYKIKLTGKDPLTGTQTLTSPVFTIEKAKPAIAWKSPATKTVDYNGREPNLSNELTVTLPVSGDTNQGDITYSYATAEGGPYTPGLPKNAGTYYIKASLAEQTNYTSADASGMLALTINKAIPTLTPPAAKNLTYNGTAQELVSPGSTDVGAPVLYALAESAPDGTPIYTYSTTIPTATDAGEYEVYYKVEETENYSGVAAASVKVTVEQAAASNIAGQVMYIQNKKEATYTLDLNQYAPAPPFGHFGAEGEDPAIIDKPGYGALEYEIKVTGYFDKDSGDVTSDNGILTIHVNNVDTATEQDVAVITVSYISYNFKPIKMPLTIKVVNKEPVTITGVTAAGWTYDGTAHNGYTGTPSAGAYTGPLDVAYSKQDGTALAGAPTDAGQYTVTISVPSDNQDYIGSAALPFTVEKAAVTVRADDKTATVGAAMPELTWRVVSGLADGEVLKTDPVPACDADMSKAGTYPITISGGAAPDGGNYKAQLVYQSGTLTVNPAGGGGGSSTPVKVTGIALDRDALTLTAGETGRLNAEVRPAGASDKRVLWSSSGPDIVSVDSEGNLTARAPGTAVITVTSRDGGFTATCTVTVTEARYAVRYLANGGSGTMPDGSALGAFVLPECGFAPPEGQEFECWAVGGVNGPRVSAGGTYLFTADTEVYALWRTPETYRAVFLGGGGEGAAITMEKLSPGAVIRLPENPFRREGHTFTGWGYGGAVYNAGAAFTMPDEDVTFTARWKATASGGGARPSGGGGGGTVGVLPVTVESTEYGKVTSSRNWAGIGSTVTLTVEPDSGYALDTLTVTDSRGDAIELTAQSGGKYAFTMPGRAVTVRAAFAPLPEGTGALCGGGEDCPSRGFRDLGGAGTWYHEAVDYVLRNGLMNGYSAGFFGPDNRLTRAQLVQILYNHAGKPAAAGGGGFTDVAADAWCVPAIAWAAERGIAGGYGNGTFGPDDAITREQLAVLLWRYAGSPAASQELRFHDAGKIAAHAREAICWAVESGVMNGKGGGVLDPKGFATRAQTAQMLKNFLENG